MKKPSLLQRITRGATSPRSLGLSSATCLMSAALLLRAATPPSPLIELGFPEGPPGDGGVGVTTTNTGTLAGWATFAEASGTVAYPAFSTNVPAGTYVPPTNDYSVDLGAFTTPGRAVDYGDYSLTLPPLTGLTVCGWLNARELARSGRIACALEGAGSGLGFELANDSIGRLSLGVNEGTGGNPSLLRLVADAQVRSNNWVFFAATYDPSSPINQLKYYFGRPDKLAALDSAYAYQGGDTISSNIDFTGPVGVGNANLRDTATRDTPSSAGNGQFRGLLDEIRVYTNALTLDEVQQAQIGGVVTPVSPTILRPPPGKSVGEGQDALFDVEASGSGLVTYQWHVSTNNGAAWVSVPGETASSFTLTNVTLADIGKQIRVGVTNAVGGSVSSAATLSVVPLNPRLIAVHFTEGNETNTNPILTPAQKGTILTANAGFLQGSGLFAQKQSTGNEAGTWPVFTTNVPVGPRAPDPAFNRYALHMGDVLYRSDGSFPGNQGGRAVDFTNSAASPVNTLGKMSGLTICGWLNSGNLTFRGTGGFGNQIASAIDSANVNGFGLANKSDDSLQLAVNEQVGGSLANRSSAGKIPAGDTNHASASWIFFAVTYDGTVPNQNLSFFFGDPDNLATNDVTVDYNRGPINATGPLTLGNFNTATPSTGRTINGENAAFWRGIVDEFHVFSRVLTQEEIRSQQVASPPAPPPPSLKYHVETNHLVLSWAGSFQLQSRPDLDAVTSWSDVATPPDINGNGRSLAVPLTNGPAFFRLRQ